ncbi:MAG: hypothetical protein Q9160_005424 [Pyrenula sp. 1 TL-2023]
MFSIFSLLFVGAISSVTAVPAPSPQQGGPELTTRDTQKSLQGFEGCSKKDSEAIIDAFHEAQKILSTPSISKLDFTSASALDYFGPADENKDWQGDLQGLWPGLYLVDQEANMQISCLQKGLRSRDSDPYFTFCHQFFDYSRLDDAIKEGQKKEKEDVRAYDNRARHWIQALMLTDDVRGPMSAKMAAITDVKMVLPDVPGKESRYVITPLTAKLLARFKTTQSTVPLAVINAHNIAWFATAAYAESKVKDNSGILAPVLDIEVGKAIAQSAVDRSGTTNSASFSRFDTLFITDTKTKYVNEADYPPDYWKRVKEQSEK